MAFNAQYWRRSRGYYKGRIHFYLNQIDGKEDDLTLAEVQNIGSRLDEARKGFEKAQTELEMNEPSDSDEQERKEFDENFYDTEMIIIKLIDSKRVVPTKEVSRPKLPDITVPKYDGDIANWLNFRDSFRELVVNRNLDSVSKYRYLETSLQGSPALNLIKTRSSTEFETAWEILLEEYDKVSLIKERHIKSLYDVHRPVKGCPKSLQQFIDTVDINLSALRSLKIPVDSWDLLLIHHLSEKLDFSLRHELEKEKKTDQDLTYSDFKDFLKRQVSILQRCGTIKFGSPLASSTPISKSFQDKTPRKVFKNNSFANSESSINTSSSFKCYICKGPHSAFKCPDFEPLSYEARVQKVRSLKACLNCLQQSNHTIKDCTSRSCRICHEMHHTLLHPPFIQKKPEVVMVTQPSEEVSCSSVNKSQVVLATAMVLIQNRSGEYVYCRAFLDGGSTSNFITEALVQKLMLKKIPSYTFVTGVNNTKSYKSQVVTTIKSMKSEYESELDFIVTNRIVGDLPQVKIDTSKLIDLPIDDLADPYFSKPQKIDILLGAETFYEIFKTERTEIAPKLWIYDTILGKIVVGKISNKEQEFGFSAVEDLKDQLQKFWEIEHPKMDTNYTLEEKAAEEAYVRTISRTVSGRYSVGLPFNDKFSLLGKSEEKSRNLFLSSERRLQFQTEKYKHYEEFMSEMLELGHMELDPKDGSPDNYIIHHMVTRPSSTTTKYRVVFNGSFPTSSNISLNDTLLVGPSIQDDLFSHHIRWREKPIGVTADITKMYRQILIHPKDRNYQKIWWRSSVKEPLNSYRLKTVTYGTSSAPFQAIRTLKQLAYDEVALHSLGSKLMERNFYVDDFVASFVDPIEAKEHIEDLVNLAAKGGFQLHKFASNYETINASDQIVTVLGIVWNLKTDNIELNIGNIKYHNEITKCSVLSEIAQMYDPLGLTSPIILSAKNFMQEIWAEHNISWEDKLPEHLTIKWKKFQSSLQQMKPILIPRCCMVSNGIYELHGFSDASKTGYGACVYIRVPDNSTTLLCAKSRVAPLKTVTIPRLELCAAVLLSRIVKKVREALTCQPIKIILWTDSMITLHRIKGPSNKYKTFVGARLSEIQENTSSTDWRFIPTELNPADLVSRSILPTDLINLKIWWNGPEFLSNPKISWPLQKEIFIEKDDEIQQQKTFIVFATTQNDHFNDVICRFSSLNKLLNVVTYCLRFAKSKRSEKTDFTYVTPNAIERKDALIRVVRICQQNIFHEEIKTIKLNKSVEKNSRLMKLNPFIDHQGILRVGGRLEYSKLSPDHQHQMIIPGDHHLARIIVENYHFKNLHCGPQSLLNTVRQEFWIINGRNLCKKVVHTCVICFRNKPKMIHQIMGQLPTNRLTPGRPFDVIGIDYFGHVNIKYEIRTKVVSKAWVCVFTCFKTRATHLELVHDYSTRSFIAALRRFAARRGTPSQIYCDNATNFTGAHNELKDLHAVLFNEVSKNQILEFCCSNQITWHFQPPRSPHFNGMHESIVKLAKYHLHRAVKDTKYTTEQLNTLLCQIESCLNSRPITPLNDDINDLKALTPGHFLIMQPMNTLPDPNLLHFNEGRLNVWQKIQYQLQNFWERWSKDYLNELQQRSKWCLPQKNLKIGQIVILHIENSPPNTWPLGKIVETNPGKDGYIRVVKVKTARGIYQRSITKVSPLPIMDSEN